MSKLPVIAALLISAAVPPAFPASAKGKPPPPPSTEFCFDDQGYTRCFYDSFSECRAEMRSLYRQHVTIVTGCQLNTVPDYEYFGQYELMYI